VNHTKEHSTASRQRAPDKNGDPRTFRNHEIFASSALADPDMSRDIISRQKSGPLACRQPTCHIIQSGAKKVDSRHQLLAQGLASTKTIRTGRAVRAVTAEGSSGGWEDEHSPVGDNCHVLFYVRAAERRVVPSLATSGAIREQAMKLDSGGIVSCVAHLRLNRIPPGERGD